MRMGVSERTDQVLTGLTCRDTEDVENGGRKSGGEREIVSQVLKLSIGD